MTTTEMAAEIARLSEANKKLAVKVARKTQKDAPIRVGAKGGISLYDSIGRHVVTLSVEQVAATLSQGTAIMEFIKANERALGVSS